jgi:hypothetical protein
MAAGDIVNRCPATFFSDSESDGLACADSSSVSFILTGAEPFELVKLSGYKTHDRH